MRKPKIMLIGLARHGKDTVAEYLRDKHNYRFMSSSMWCSEAFIFDALKDKYGYKTPQECFDDRVNHRAEWYDMIKAFNTPDLARLGREIFSQNEIYCGIRDVDELRALKNAGVFDYAVWVDAVERKGITEGKDSNNISITEADWILTNNGTIEELYEKIEGLLPILEMRERSVDE